jgi:hypothetical protein
MQARPSILSGLCMFERVQALWAAYAFDRPFRDVI